MQHPQPSDPQFGQGKALQKRLKTENCHFKKTNRGGIPLSGQTTMQVWVYTHFDSKIYADCKASTKYGESNKIPEGVESNGYDCCLWAQPFIHNNYIVFVRLIDGIL